MWHIQRQPKYDVLSDEEHVKQIVLEINYQLLRPSLSPFILQILGKILIPRSMFPPLRVDSFVLPKKGTSWSDMFCGHPKQEETQGEQHANYVWEKTVMPWKRDTSQHVKTFVWF